MSSAGDGNANRRCIWGVFLVLATHQLNAKETKLDDEEEEENEVGEEKRHYTAFNTHTQRVERASVVQNGYISNSKRLKRIHYT